MKKTVFRPEGFLPRILIVDDDKAALALVEKILHSDSCLVTSVETGQKALELLKTAPAPYDLLIADAMMPEMDGYELVALVRTDAAILETPILMLTRLRQREDLKKALTAGATDYVMKPIDAPLLKEKVRRLVGRRPA